jgi:hypothetical protein
MCKQDSLFCESISDVEEEKEKFYNMNTRERGWNWNQGHLELWTGPNWGSMVTAALASSQ